ncbi:hypothetical protein ACWGS9_14245, partial [Bradyrhizobium sp. Arg314]
DCWSFSWISGNKKGPRGSLCDAHGGGSPGGYTALPTRKPTRMSAVFMGADTKGVKGNLSTAKMTPFRHLPAQAIENAPNYWGA